MPDNDAKAVRILNLLETARQIEGEEKDYLSMGTSDRLREVANELFDGNLSELARQLDMKPELFSKYTSGDTVPGSRLLLKLFKLGINPTWILTGKGEMRMPDDRKERALTVTDRNLAHELEKSGISLQRVPQLKVDVSAGDGVEVYESDEVEEDEEWLSEAFIRREYSVAPEKVRTLRVHGNSMIPTIEPGDRIRVAVWDGETLWENNVYVIHTPGGLTVKRYSGLTNGHVLLTADNEDVRDREIPGERWDEDYRPVAWALEVTTPL
jgi:phage repressor protein C with HTH and peptisase S24 domain